MADPRSIDVLFVRHCEACHNISKLNLKRTFKRTPLCSAHGAVATIWQSGTKIANLVRRGGYQRVELYASALPRAIQTAKLIHQGLQQVFLQEPRQAQLSVDVGNKIRPLCFLTEMEHFSDRLIQFLPFRDKTTVNRIRFDKLKGYVRALERLMPGEQGWGFVSLDALQKASASPDDTVGCFESGGPQDFDRFQDTAVRSWLNDASENDNTKTLRVVVTHGAYLREFVFPHVTIPQQFSSTMRNDRVQNAEGFLIRFFPDEDQRRTPELLERLVIPKDWRRRLMGAPGILQAAKTWGFVLDRANPHDWQTCHYRGIAVDDSE